ncbi:MAG: IS1634 family transposase [Candidatus Cloacimonas sp.]|jgi:transposase|nr:IS1634 family transposase [Candidatus Cloacimonas sp.]
MFIKKVIKTYKSTGKSYTEYRFVRGYRTSVGPRHQTLLTVRDIPLPETQWKLLADTLDALLNLEVVLFVDESVLALAKHYCNLIRARNPEFGDKGNQNGHSDKSKELIYQDSVQIFNDRSFGPEYIASSMYKKLDLDALFTKLGYPERQRKLISLSIMGRLVAPGSENSTRLWAKELSAIDELIDCDLSRLGHNSLYRISDTIYKHKDEIETYLCQQERSIFNLQESLCLYDLTNTFLEGSGASIPKASFGRSKEKRRDCRLLTLGMVVDELGFCKKSNILEGSVSEPNTLKEMIDTLSANLDQNSHPIIVMDAGIAKKENLQYLRDAGYHYLCVSRNSPLPLDKVSPERLIEVHRDKHNLVEAQVFEDGHELLLYCHSQKMESKERAMQDSYGKRFEDDLGKIIASLTKKYSNKDYGKIMQRIGRIKERYSSIGRFYHIDVFEEGGKVNAIEYHKVKLEVEEDRFSGSYWLRTSYKDWDEKQIWQTYMMLNRIEAAFRSLKHELAFRPIFHSTGNRADAHIFIAVLAYHLLNAIGLKLRQEGIHDSWNTVRNMMSTHRRVSFSGLTDKNTIVTQRITTSAEAFHLKIYKALNMSPNPTLKATRNRKM